MKSVDITGPSVTEIINRYARDNRLNIDDLRYEVINKGSSGFLGIGRKPATVRFLIEGVEQRICSFVEQLLEKLDIRYSAVKCSLVKKTAYIEIENPDDPGFLIGKNGTMLETLQFMVNRVFEKTREIERIYLDAGNYRQRREKQFLAPFLPLIKQVKSTGKALTMEPMPAPERRIIHRHIESEPTLRTLTVGEGDNKRIVIFSAKQNEKEVMKKVTPEPNNAKSRPSRSHRPNHSKKSAGNASSNKRREA